MRIQLLAAGAALFLIGEVSANAPPPPPPKTKPTSTAPAPNPPPKIVPDTTRGLTIFIGSALALALASGGLLAFRRHSKQS